MVCGGDTILNNSGVKNIIKTEYSSILSQTNPTPGGFPMGKGRRDSQEPSALSKNHTALMKNINYNIYIKPSQK